jgi:hypothetical protein
MAQHGFTVKHELDVFASHVRTEESGVVEGPGAAEHSRFIGMTVADTASPQPPHVAPAVTRYNQTRYCNSGNVVHAAIHPSTALGELPRHAPRRDVLFVQSLTTKCLHPKSRGGRGRVRALPRAGAGRPGLSVC